MQRETFNTAVDLVIKEHRDPCHRHRQVSCLVCAQLAVEDANECIKNLTALNINGKFQWFRVQRAIWQLVAEGVLS